MNKTSKLGKLKQLDKMTLKQQQEFWKKYLEEGKKNERYRQKKNKNRSIRSY